MDIQDLADFLLVASSGLLLTTIAFAIAWVRARERLLRFRAQAVEPREVSRPDRVDQAVEAIAVEVERIGEQQRFLTKLLVQNGSNVGAARSAAASGGDLPAPRVITPH